MKGVGIQDVGQGATLNGVRGRGEGGKGSCPQEVAPVTPPRPRAPLKPLPRAHMVDTLDLNYLAHRMLDRIRAWDMALLIRNLLVLRYITMGTMCSGTDVCAMALRSILEEPQGLCLVPQACTSGLLDVASLLVG